jgi:hypothetical protein
MGGTTALLVDATDPTEACSQGGVLAEDGLKLRQNPPTSRRYAMDLGLMARSELANHHGWIS